MVNYLASSSSRYVSLGATNGKSGKTESFEWAKGKPFDIFMQDGECRNLFGGGCTSVKQ